MPHLQGFSQGTPEPAHLKRRTYGPAGTIHQTGTIDIEINSKGMIVGVWFRCLALPYKVVLSTESSPWAGNSPQGSNDEIAIEAITYVEKGTRTR